MVNACHSILNVKVLVGALNQKKDLVGAFSVILQLHQLIVSSTSLYTVYTQRQQPRPCHASSSWQHREGGGVLSLDVGMVNTF